MKELKRTREFMFPNGGHSVRKLAASLESLGDTTVEIKYALSDMVFAGDREDTVRFNMYFEEVIPGSYTDQHRGNKFNARLLASKLRTIGTRFTCTIKYGNQPDLNFTTDWSDLNHYSEAYGLL